MKNKMTYILPNFLMVFTVICISICNSSCNEEARGFALPEGNIEQGKVTYERLACNECHSISDIEWKGGRDSLKIQLGGEVSSKISYGHLVTSVINPSHKIAPNYKQMNTTETGHSTMKNYNDIMTVQELINLVTFLQSEYKVSIPTTYYSPYY